MTETSKVAMDMLANGGICNHKLSNAASVHTGEEEQKELSCFRDYLTSKNGCLTMGLKDDLIFIEYHDEKSGKIMANTHPYRGKGNLFNQLFSYEYLNEEKMIRLTAKAEFSPLINAFIIFTILASVFLIKDLIPVTFFCMFFILIQRAFWNPFYRTKTDLCNIIDHINKYGDDGFNLIEEKRQAEKQFEKIIKDYDQRAGIDESSQINWYITNKTSKSDNLHVIWKLLYLTMRVVYRKIIS